MGEITKIQWTDHTFNPWEGCTKVSPGCNNCYAEAQNKRWGKDNWGKGKPRRRTSEANWRKPLQWNREADKFVECRQCGARGSLETIFGPVEVAHHELCAGCGAGPDWSRGTMNSARPRVFCASMADWLDDEVPIEWLVDLLALIAATPSLDWQLLTKRPENWFDRLLGVVKEARSAGGILAQQWLNAADGVADGVPENVWIGTTVEDQRRADERIPHLLAIPARVRFLSIEPQLEAVDLGLMDDYIGNPDVATMAVHSGRIHWVIVGGESGNGARPFKLEWARSLVRQCKDAHVPVFVKQLGGNVQWHVALSRHGYITNRDKQTLRVNLHDRKGGDPAEWPSDLRVRQFPVPR